MTREMSMDFTTTTDRFRLDTLSKARENPRPTIPYSQFPRRALPNLATSFDHSSRQRGEENIPDALASAKTTDSVDLTMDPGTPSNPRGQRSSLMSNDVGNQHSWRTGPQQGREGVPDEQKWSGDESPGSADGSLSASAELEVGDFSEEEGLEDDEETGLTRQARSQRKDRKRQNTSLDQRIASDTRVTKEEKAEAYQDMIRRMAINGVLIGLWYLFSLSISLYNTWMFSRAHLDFHFPLFTTSVHMLVQFTLASTVLYFIPRFRPRYNSISNVHNIHATEADRARHEEEEKKPLMTRWFYLTRLGPCGMATGLDIGLGNASLKYISLSFYTMCKSSSLAFVLMFAFLFRLETPSWRLVAIIATMTVGVVMMVFGEINYSALGFMLVISAAFFSGFRWGLTQILLLRNPATSNPFSSIFYLAPIMFFTLFTLAIPVEGFSALAERFGALIDDKGLLLGPAIILVPGVIAFLMTASEFALLQRTSVVTLSIAGIFKEVVTIAAAGFIFDDTLTPINISGLFVTIGAIAAYNYIKIKKMGEETLLKIHVAHTHQIIEDADRTTAVPTVQRHEPYDGDGDVDDEHENENEWERSAMLSRSARQSEDGNDARTKTSLDLSPVDASGRT